MDFNFLTEPQPDISEQPKYVGPNIKDVVKMTPRKFATSVLEVYNELGGASWLIQQAHIDPKAFLALLAKLIPKSVQLDDLADLKVTLIDQFGATIEVETNKQIQPATNPSQSKLGQLQIDTGGNLTPSEDNSSSPLEGSSTTQEVDIKDIFE